MGSVASSIIRGGESRESTHPDGGTPTYTYKVLLQDSTAQANPAKPRLNKTKQVRAVSAALITLLSPLRDSQLK